MRIVVWNCNQGFADKAHFLAALRPDIAIIPECGRRDAESFSSSLFGPTSREWVGANPLKGLAAFAFGGFSLQLDPTYDDRLQWVAPLHVKGPLSFSLLAVWAMNQKAKSFHPQPPTRRQIQQALVVYEAFLALAPAVMAGDFNDATCWDHRKPHPEDFSTAVRALTKLDLVSSYHAARGVPFGSEADPTIYWRDRKVDGFRFHIDYCFLPATWKTGLRVDVGTHADWVASKRSDHVPLVVNVDPPRPLASV